MNVRTLRKTLDRYGFETGKVLDCLLDVYIKQHVSDRGVLAQDVSGPTGVLVSYNLLEKGLWNKVVLFTCTPKGEKIAQELLKEKVAPVFEQFKQLNLEGSYLILKYLMYLINQGKNLSSRNPELKLLSPLPVIQGLTSSMRLILLDYGLAKKPHKYTASKPTQEVTVTLPDLFNYFEQYYTKEQRISSFETILRSTSRKLNLFRLLYSYEPKAERIFLRKLKEYRFSLEDFSDILEVMKQKNLINYLYNPVLFKIEDKNGYKTFLKDNVLSHVLDEFSHQIQQPIHTNPQAYAALAEFEEKFRAFVEERLQNEHEPWETRIPKDILERLKERQNDAKIRGKTVYPLLDYIDFPNYLSIILYRTKEFSNWEVFEPYFVSIGWIKARLIEMNEIRNDLAHPKPLEPLQYRKLQLYIDEIRERIRQ